LFEAILYLAYTNLIERTNNEWIYSGSTVGLQWVYSGSTVALQRTKDEQWTVRVARADNEKTNNERTKDEQKTKEC